MFFTLVICFLFAGCSSLENQKAFETEPERAELLTEVTETISTTATTEQTASASKIYPLPDTTMDNLSDTILSISLEEGDAYVDDTGKMQMDVTIWKCTECILPDSKHTFSYARSRANLSVLMYLFLKTILTSHHLPSQSA